MFVIEIDKCILVDVLEGVDVFVGLFGVNLLELEDFKCMVLNLIVFVCLNLDLEIKLELVYVICNDVIMVIGCFDYLN